MPADTLLALVLGYLLMLVALDLLQSYGEGWQSGAFQPQERQLFGFPGGVVNRVHWKRKDTGEDFYLS